MNSHPDRLKRYLLTCLSYQPGDIDQAKLEPLTESDWDDLLALADQQRVRPLLFQRFKKGGLKDVVPAAAYNSLQNRYIYNSVRNLRFYAELEKIVKTMRGVGIEVIVLKGAFLADVVYGNFALREMNDIDLLVSVDDVAGAADVLAGLGYLPQRPYTIDEELIATEKHLPRFIKADVLGIEVHWNITKSVKHYHISMEGLWERAVVAKVNIVNTLALSAEDLLLHLCLHASYQHQFAFGLRPFCDISEVINHYGNGIDWEGLCRRVDSWGWQKGVYLTLRLAREFVGAAVPDAVLSSLKPNDLDEMVVVAAWAQVFADKYEVRDLSAVVSWTPDRNRDKVKLLIGRLFPPKGIISGLYSVMPDSPKIYYYYLVRFWGLLMRHGRFANRLLRGEQEITRIARRVTTLSSWLESDSPSS